jgi:hypothetical protein
VNVTHVSFSFFDEQGQHWERTNLSNLIIRTDCKQKKQLTNVLNTLTASPELGSIVRGRGLVFLSSTTERVNLTFPPIFGLWLDVVNSVMKEGYTEADYSL